MYSSSQFSTAWEILLAKLDDRGRQISLIIAQNFEHIANKIQHKKVNISPKFIPCETTKTGGRQDYVTRLLFVIVQMSSQQLLGEK